MVIVINDETDNGRHSAKHNEVGQWFKSHIYTCTKKLILKCWILTLWPLSEILHPPSMLGPEWYLFMEWNEHKSWLTIVIVIVIDDETDNGRQSAKHIIHRNVCLAPKYEIIVISLTLSMSLHVLYNHECWQQFPDTVLVLSQESSLDYAPVG